MAANDQAYKDDVAPDGSPFRPLYDDKIRFNGQPIALVVAETSEIARFAASLVRVEYDEAAHVTDVYRQRDAANPVKPPKDPMKAMFTPPKARGDAKQIPDLPLANVASDDAALADGKLVSKRDASRAVSITDAMRHGGVDRVEQEATTNPSLDAPRAHNTHSAIFAEVKDRRARRHPRHARDLLYRPGDRFDGDKVEAYPPGSVIAAWQYFTLPLGKIR